MGIPDSNIIQQCKKGNRKAQFVLYKWCFSLLMPICLRYRNNQQDAGSNLNEGFFKILDNLNKYPEHVPLEAWVKRIMINHLIDDFRKNKKYKDLTENLEPNQFEVLSGSVDFNLAEEEMEAEELRLMISNLPPMSAQVFNLYALDGYQHKEIASLLNISEGTSKWHLNNARTKLAQQIEQRLTKSKNVKYG
jgi:RNA polymerase sigma-70 factor (ECF subfamily)